MNDLCYHTGEAALAIASTWVFGVLGENFGEFIRGDESEVFEIIFESVVGLVEPELIEVENTGFVAIEPDGVAFGFAKFATGDFINDERAGVGVGFGVLEAANKMNARGAVAVLVGAAELKIDVMSAEKVEEVIALNKSIAKLGVRDTGAAFADAFLDKLAVKELSHTESFADFAEEWKEFDFTKPVIVIKNSGVLWRMGNTDDLAGESGLVALNFIEALEVAFGGILWVANLTGGATDEIIRSISVADEAGAHHKCSEVADV